MSDETEQVTQYNAPADYLAACAARIRPGTVDRDAIVNQSVWLDGRSCRIIYRERDASPDGTVTIIYVPEDAKWLRVPVSLPLADTLWVLTHG